jgi:hypothetical protein
MITINKININNKWEPETLLPHQNFGIVSTGTNYIIFETIQEATDYYNSHNIPLGTELDPIP